MVTGEIQRGHHELAKIRGAFDDVGGFAGFAEGGKEDGDEQSDDADDDEQLDERESGWWIESAPSVLNWVHVCDLCLRNWLSIGRDTDRSGGGTRLHQSLQYLVRRRRSKSPANPIRAIVVLARARRRQIGAAIWSVSDAIIFSEEATRSPTMLNELSIRV